MTETYYTTPAGYRRFLDRLKTVANRYDTVTASNGDASDSGDNSVWHDNFAYEENQRLMHQWATRFHSLEEIKSNLVIIDIDTNPDTVKIGCEVVIYDLSDDTEKNYIIAGYEDGDPDIGRISYTSPIAQAILGAEEGDLRKLKIGNKIKELEIIEIKCLMESYE